MNHLMGGTLVASGTPCLDPDRIGERSTSIRALILLFGVQRHVHVFGDKM